MFKSSLYFSGFKPTRKESEVIYLLVTNTNILNKAQNKADNLLQNVCGKRQTTINKHLLENYNLGKSKENLLSQFGLLDRRMNHSKKE